MCDYCGCRRSGPTSELAREHEQLIEMRDRIWNDALNGVDVTALFGQMVDLLQRHAVKEEIGLFVQAREFPQMVERIDTLCAEHEQLYAWLSGGPHGAGRDDAFHLLGTHIDDEEYDLFPHIFHALDDDQWREIELAHRAVDQTWDGPTPAHDHPHDHDHDHPHDHNHDHPHDHDH